MTYLPSARTGSSSVLLLDVDPDLGEHLSPRAREQARRTFVVSVLTADTGPWDPPRLEAGSIGLLVIDGLIARRVKLAGAAACELLGPGDILRPLAEGLPEQLVPSTVEWQALQPMTFAVLDRRASMVISQWPELAENLIGRIFGRAHALAHLMAAQHFSRIEDRLLGTLWHLASRWGRVRPDGIMLPFALSHEMLGQIIGAARPSVTLAVAALERKKLLARDAARRLVLLQDPVDWESPQPTGRNPPSRSSVSLARVDGHDPHQPANGSSRIRTPAPTPGADLRRVGGGARDQRLRV